MAPPIGSEASPPRDERGQPPGDLPTLIYDGDCTFCGNCADWIAARLPDGTPVIPAQQADLSTLRLTREQASEAAWWIDTDGTQHRGHRAIAAALRACGGSWTRLGQALTWPGISLLAAGVYELTARNRHRLGCTNCLEKSQRGGPALS